MTILVAPLNWGLGHASRCVPLVHRFIEEGHDVILGGDGESLTLLRKHFPKLRYVYLAPLLLRYSEGGSQVWAMLKALPRLLVWSIKDHAMLKAVLREEHIDRVVSDNRFGLYNATTECIYMTHQLHIRFPKGWRWMEDIAARVHARIYAHYNKVWIPDYEEPDRCLAGELSHPNHLPFSYLPCTIEYIGPLSRFQNNPINLNYPNTPNYSVVAILSGLEPHRTLFEKELIARYAGKEEDVLIVQGLMNRPNTHFKRGKVTIVPYLGDKELSAAIQNAKHIIARSGYSTIMDLDALGLLTAKRKAPRVKIELIPTPGQPEQEYLATYIEQKTLF